MSPTRKRIDKLEKELHDLENATLTINENLLIVTDAFVRMKEAFEKCICPYCEYKTRCLFHINKNKGD